MFSFFNKKPKSKNTIEVVIDGINPQTDNEFLFYNFVEDTNSLYLKAWYEQLQKQNYMFKPQYKEAIHQKISTNKFKNPHTFPEYFDGEFDYIAIDFETANNNRISACAIGLAFVKNGYLVHTLKRYIKPPKEEKFTDFHTNIHGINESHMEFALNFNLLWRAEFSKYFNTNLLVLHNASMDASILRNLFEYYNIENTTISYLDTMLLADKAGYPKKLTELAQKFNIEIKNHHDPLCDAQACANVYDELIKIYPNHKDLIKNLDKTSEKKSFWNEPSNELKEENIEIVNLYLIEKNELENLSFLNKGVVITGEFTTSRQVCTESIIRLKGNLKSAITKNVDYVIIGQDYGWSKIQKIHELNTTKNCNIKILTEDDLSFLIKNKI
jgi:DNA polymerase-3 subunit epsilon